MEGNNDLPKISRRTVIKTALGAGLAGLAGKVIADQRNSNQQRTEVSPTPQSDLKTPTQESERLTQTPEATLSPKREMSQAERETSEHLAKIYGETMDSKSFPTEKDKHAFFEKVTEIAKELNPKNPNLANQLVAVMMYETEGSLKTTYQDRETGGVGIFPSCSIRLVQSVFTKSN